ncbi:MAG: hypothetical protein A2152_04125 [Candidatus Levybacteria bacterium RBG_16_35_6]|nr:MAG: hypothetical protein A2152_04125 [Candidatus Levybacteria bacterium RBG_16_35_6]
MVLLASFPVKPNIRDNEFYFLASRCGFVNKETGKCDAYVDPKRPAKCEIFQAGCLECREMKYRQKTGYQFGY